MPDPEQSIADIVGRLATLPVANISDAMDRFGVLDAAIGPVWPGARLAGPAFTVQTTAGDNQVVHEVLDLVSPGDVLVIDGQAHVNRALLGELIAAHAVAKGVTGIVVDGAIRDAEDLEALGIPVFTRAITPAGPRRSGPGRHSVPITVGGVVVDPGDIVVGDRDGVAVVPRAKAIAITLEAERKHTAEADKRAAILALGAPK